MVRQPSHSITFSACLLICLVSLGCTRDRYRLQADVDAYGRLLEKANCTPWAVPSDFSVYPRPDSRLHDPSCVNDPCLPMPAPQLYEYDLPPRPERDPARFYPEKHDSAHPQSELPGGGDHYDPTTEHLQLLPSPEPVLEAPAATSPADESLNLVEPIIEDAGASRIESVDLEPVTISHINFEQIFQNESQSEETLGTLLSEETQDTISGRSQVDVEQDVPQPADLDTPEGIEAVLNAEESDVQANQVPLPRSYWETIPKEFLARMFEFQSVRDEYARSYGAPPKTAQLDGSPKLALEDIIDITLLNSRELQTQKERLYQVALVLTLQRFQYQLRPSFGNNGTAANWIHDNSAGITQNTLRIPTTAQLQSITYTGADFIGRFANSILLTFNGAQGFNVDVGSSLLFDFSQSLLQRDIRLENLTQAERDVVYAARDFTRFRKELFVQQATDYYSLIRRFRQIEIQCQNYFTLAREFNQRSVEIKYGMAARTQLDQVEQQVINGRQSILSSITDLENALDSLKIRMGVPTELPLNLDLTELNLLTLRDELAVNAELIERTRTRIEREVQSDSRSAFVILGGVAQLAEQMIDSLRLRLALGDDSFDFTPLESRLLELRIEAADIDVAEDRAILDQELSDQAPDSTKVIQRRRDVSQELLRKIFWQIRLLRKAGESSEQIAEWLKRYQRLGARLTELENSFLDMIFRDQNEIDGQSEKISDAESALIQTAESLQNNVQQFASQLDSLLGRMPATDDAGFNERAIANANELMAESERFRTGSSGGLVPITIDMDEAMMTALVQRFDLMNQRGFLADDWRNIKYAADDLRSILNLRASQLIETRSGENKPFDFTFDDSTTSVGVTLDLPFNRRAQRNNFRASLFNYQQTLRNLMALEDNIKLSIRRDLRSLNLNGQQYANDVAGAALASERVTGTELEVRSGFATSRDFLESQQAYVQAISGVASDHINFIVGRLQLFLDLESLTVGDNGFWDELYDEEYQPTPVHQLPAYARPAYGLLHPKLKYSWRIQRMRCVPNGVSMIHEPLAEPGLLESDEEFPAPVVAQ